MCLQAGRYISTKCDMADEALPDKILQSQQEGAAADMDENDVEHCGGQGLRECKKKDESLRTCSCQALTTFICTRR